MPTDPQGYPIQQYKNMQDVAVMQILSDGTVVLNNNNSNLTDDTVELLIGDGDPNGNIVAPEGSLYVDFTTPDVWQNQDGDTTWKSLAHPVGGVTSWKGRTGAVVPLANDYNNILDLIFADGAGNQISFDSSTPALFIGGGLGGGNLQMNVFTGVTLNSTVKVTFSDSIVNLQMANGHINISALSVFANNAAALGGGLNVGDLYRTGGDPDTVCIVH